jgi:hypothetical protein
MTYRKDLVRGEKESGKRYMDQIITHLSFETCSKEFVLFSSIPLTTNRRFCLVPLHGAFTKQRVFY